MDAKENYEGKKMSKGLLVLAILFGLLLLFSITQTVQISNIKQDIAFGQAALGIPVVGGPARSAPQASAPTMVGGC